MGTGRGLAAVWAFFWGVMFFGIIDLTVPFDQLPGFYDGYLLETGWGVLYTWLVAAPLLGLVVRPTMTAILLQIAVVGGCVAVAAHVTFAWGQLLPAATLLATAATIYRVSAVSPDRVASVEPRGAALGPHWPVLWVAGSAVPFSAWVGFGLATSYWQRWPPTDDITWFLDHWPMQAALALALPAVAALASLRTSGWRISLLSVFVAGCWWGALSVVYPTHAGSLGSVGGWLAICWSAALLAASLVPVRTRPGSHDDVQCSGGWCRSRRASPAA